MLSKQLKNALAGIAVAALLGGVGFFIWEQSIQQKSDSLLEAMRNEKEKTNAEKVSEGEAPVVANKETKPPIPELDRPITITTSLSGIAADEARKKIAELTAEIKEDSEFYNNWVELGIYRKMIGDYVSAREAWEYAASIAPLEPVPFNNLANLYIYFLNDFTKGEKYLLGALERAPKSLIYYENAYEFYALIKKDFAKAREVLEQGIVKSPENEPALKDLLSRIPPRS